MAGARPPSSAAGDELNDDLDVSVTIPEDKTKPIVFDVPESAYRFRLVERAVRCTRS
jgi:hypothetical protein